MRSDEYEQKFAEYSQRYKKAKLYRVIVDILGEMIGRCIAIEEEHMMDADTLYVLIPIDSRGNEVPEYANRMVSEYIGFCKQEETDFWAYVAKAHPEWLDISGADRYATRWGLPAYFRKANSIPSHFTEEDERAGRQQLEKMGLDRNFVLFAARSSEYNKERGRTDLENRQQFRNASFSEYSEAILFLKDQNISAVRMGRLLKKMEPVDNLVDYGGSYADDFMDLFLMANCDFLVAGDTGIITMPSLFSKPMLYVNMATITYGFGGSRYTEYDLYIPKRFYDTKEKRFLSFMEILKLQAGSTVDDYLYKKNHIVLYENTAQEIREAVEELLGRLNGTWTDTDEDMEAYKRYADIYETMVKEQTLNKSNNMGAPLPARPAATFLRMNRYLLE